MIASSGGSEQVVGDVFRLDDPERDLPLLDEYEGCGLRDSHPHEFERRAMPIQMNDGGALDAWVYLYCLETAGRIPILSGDYLNSRGG